MAMVAVAGFEGLGGLGAAAVAYVLVVLGAMLDGPRSPPLYLDNFVVARRRP